MRHKAGATFGPNGPSRRPAQENDPVYELCSDDEDEDPELPEFEVADLSEPQPLEIKDFVDQIDNRRGFYHDMAETIDDFRRELSEADLQRETERDLLQRKLEENRTELLIKKKQYVQQLVNVLALPLEGDSEI